MKKLFGLLIVLCLAVSVVFAVIVASAEKYDVRNVRWGMSKEEVKQKEKAELTGEGNDRLYYKTMLFGNQYELYYIFDDDRLVEVQYGNLFSERPDKEDFEKARKLLTKKYGKPRITYNKKDSGEMSEWKHKYTKVSLARFDNNTSIWYQYVGSKFDEEEL